MRNTKYKAWSKCCQDFLNITGFECVNGEITGIIHDGDYVGYDKDDITLLQYIGINDVDDKEIYEGYVVRCWGGEHCQGYWQYDETITIDSINNPFAILSLTESENIEIVGNIYENPELLKPTMGI